jgi:hypothetical protein
LWKYFSDLQEFIEHVKTTAPRCLDAGERKAYFLDAGEAVVLQTSAR